MYSAAISACEKGGQWERAEEEVQRLAEARAVEERRTKEKEEAARFQARLKTERSKKEELLKRQAEERERQVHPEVTSTCYLENTCYPSWRNMLQNIYLYYVRK